MIPKKTTKMIVKDGNGGYLQLLPEAYTDSALNASSSDPISNAAATSALNAAADRVAELSLFKVMEEEPTALNTQGTADKAIFAWIQPLPSWSITIDTSKYTHWSSTLKTGQVPLVFNPNDTSSQNAAMRINWGDGNVSTYTPETAYTYVYPEHEYEESGIYTITIDSEDFDKIYIANIFTDEGEAFGPSISAATVTSINTPLPKVAGTYSYYAGSYIENSFQSCWLAYKNLVSIPSGMFDNNPDILSFDSTFAVCQSLTSIPAGLFDSNTLATGFGACFSMCSSLTSIPSGLFANNTAATGFRTCFYNCPSLNDFTLHIGSSSVSNCDIFVTSKANTTRTVYVPSGSTTQTTFNAQASSLGLTVIGE